MKVASDDGVIKVGSHVSLGPAPSYLTMGTVVALENYHGELQMRRTDGSVWFAHREDLEVVAPRKKTLEAGGDIQPDGTKIHAEPGDVTPGGGDPFDDEELDSTVPLAPAEEGKIILPKSKPEVVAEEGNGLTLILAHAIAKAKKAKKSAVLLREMEKAGYGPRKGRKPTPSTTLEGDWKPTKAAKAERDQNPDVEFEEGRKHPTQRELDEIAADAKRRKKGIKSWMRRSGWTFVGTPEDILIPVYWIRAS